CVVTGEEDRQWLYPAMTRGTDENYALVMTSSPRAADPAAGPAPAPEIARYDRLQRLRAGLPAGQPDEEQHGSARRPRSWPTSSPEMAPSWQRPSTGAASWRTPTTSGSWTPCGRTPYRGRGPSGISSSWPRWCHPSTPSAPQTRRWPRGCGGP